MYKFKLPIGDWSGDGHDKCEWFVIESNKTFEDVEKAFKAAKKKHKNVNPEKICNEYEESTMAPETWTKLKEMGFRFSYMETLEDIEGYETCEYDAYMMQPDMMVEIVLWFIGLGDPELKLSVVSEEDMPTFRQGFGYGLFG